MPRMHELERAIARALLSQGIERIVGYGRHKPSGAFVHILDERMLWGSPEYKVKFVEGSGLETWWYAPHIEVLEPIRYLKEV